MAFWKTMLGGVVRSVIGEGVQQIAGALVHHFTTHGALLERALCESCDETFSALEAALAGPSFLKTWGRRLKSADHRQVISTVEGLLADHPHCQTAPDRRRCLEALQQARQTGLLLPDQSGQPLLEAVGAEAEQPRVENSLRELSGDLSDLLSHPALSGRPLGVDVCRAFFLLRLQQDEALFRTVTFIQAEAVPAGFQELHVALSSQGEEITTLLHDHFSQFHELLDEIRATLSRNDLPAGDLSPKHSFSIHNETERRLIHDLLARFRALPDDLRQQAPDVQSGLGELLFGAGEPGQARIEFDQAAAHCDDPQEEAQARYNAYRAALEEQDHAAALEEILAAAKLAPGRYEPFPLQKYRPKKILGAGGFGVAFLCEKAFTQGEVVIKALHASDLARKPQEVFGEAEVLNQLNHNEIINMVDCDYADPQQQRRPYIVMEYFPGETLQSHISRHGPLSVADLAPIAAGVMQAMHAAHSKNILHRDIKPDNLLVRRVNNRWQVKVIDFGLALRRNTIEQSMARTGDRSILGSSAAGTLDYAPPEQMDRLPGAAPGPYSDVYSFGRLCCYALFQVTEPRTRQLKTIPAALAELLEDCIEHKPEDRPQDFQQVYQRFRQALQPPKQSPAPKPSPPIATPTSATPKPVKQTPAPKPPRAGEERRDNGLQTALCWCPAGRFTMGSPSGEQDRQDNENQVEVTLSHGFWMAKYPVTQAEYEKVMGKNPSWFCATGDGKKKVRRTDTSRFPVESVSWHDAVAFCRKFTELERKAGRLPPDWEYALPTEAQWEYACRAGTAGPFGVGDGNTLSSKIANFDGNLPCGGAEKEECLKRTSNVGDYPANPWGLHDMHGNVWEWCHDEYQDHLPGGTNPLVDSAGSSHRVRRGGCWGSHGRFCRSAVRGRGRPDARSYGLGFRLARIPSHKQASR